MEIGKLSKRILIQKCIPNLNENGFESETLEDYKTVWASVSNLHGKEYFAARAVQEENTVKFTIRYLAGLDQRMKILFQGKAYNITAIDNIKYRNRYIEIKATEVESGG
ncbi:phage head closure protein [Peptoclostridium acidaminophilum]|uniref:phage head closure protein n=1 Tax=Peptoclostridium acidaminophilum TaxID=1731 RepID=UPI00046CD8E0|nr:phage head closure protein [Peptoclostridium acidaminophilum]